MNPVDYVDLLTEPSNQRKVRFLLESQSNKSIPMEDEDLRSSDENYYRQQISQLELRLAEQTGLHNDEIGKLHEDISKLNSSFEKNELLRQKLEYEVTLAQQETNKERRKATENDEIARAQIQMLQGEISQLNAQLKSAEDLLTESKQISKAEISHVTENNKMVQAVNIELKRENEILYEEKLAAEKLVVTWKRKSEELVEKCELLEKQRNDHSDTIRKLIKDCEFISEKEQELVIKTQDLMRKIKTLEENIEAERAAHLETKFNTEVIQLKVRDAENLLEIEKARYQECRNNLQNVDSKYRDLEAVSGKERDMYTQLTIRYDQTKEELATNKKEITEKNKHLTGISSEVKNYGHHVKGLMTELEETQNKLSDVKASKDTTTKELKFLLNNYKLISEVAVTPVQKNGWQFSDLTEQIRKILENYQGMLSQYEAKSKDTSGMIEKLTDECTTHREIAWNRDRALEEAERLVKNAQNGLSQCQIKCATYEEKFERMKYEEEHMKHLFMEKDERISNLNQDVCKNGLELDQNYQNTMNNLQVIYELLMMDGSPNKLTHERFTVSELKDSIMNRIKDDHQNNRVMKEKINMMKEQLEKTKIDIQQHKSGIKKLQKLNSQVLNETEKSLVGRQHLWEREKQKFEEEKRKYEEEILFLNTKITVKEENMQNALKQYNGVSITDIPALLDKIKQLEEDRNSSSVFINIITSSLWGLLFQHHLYGYQKRILLQMINKLLILRDDVLEITQTLQDEMVGGETIEKNYTGLPKTGIFRFRMIVIVVLALNRLLKISSYSSCLLLRQKPNYGHNGLCFFKGDQKTGENKNEPNVRIKGLLEWLMKSSEDNLKHFGDLSKNNGEPLEKNLSIVSSYYGNYLQSISRCFKHSSVLSLKEDTSRSSLVQLLGNGLAEILSSKKYQNYHYPTSINIVDLLRENILDFTTKLREGEEVKKSLKTDRDRYREGRNKYRHELELERTQFSALKMKETSLKNQIGELENNFEGMVQEEQMDEICADLKSALKREEELQILFEKQMQQVQQMEKRIERHEECFENKDKELSETILTLRTVQRNILQKEEIIEEQQSRIANFKHDKSHLQKCINHQEEKLGTFICDREILARYMRHATSVIYNSKKQMNESVNSINKAMNDLLTPSNSPIMKGIKKTPEITLVQNTIKVFYDAQRESLMKLSILQSENHDLQTRKKSLEEELNAHQQHIKSLKHRVSALFHQDVNEGQKNMLVAGTVSMPQLTHDAIFIPLQEH